MLSMNINDYPYSRAQIGGRAQFRCELVVRRTVNCPELGSDPHFFTFAGRSLTRPPTLK